MDSAHLGDFVPVAAKDIGSIEGWADLKWFCLGCPVRMVPKACDPDEDFDRVPHFAHWPGEEHGAECGIEGLETLIGKARKKKPIQSNDVLLGTLPYSVKFSRSKMGSTIPPSGIGPEGDDGPSVDAIGPPKPTRFTRPSRSSIYDICRAHAAFRNGEFRESQSLNVEGCLGSNYLDTFYQLQDVPRENPPKLNGCIFYGELHFRNKPIYNDPENLVLTLNRGSRSNNGRTAPFYRVIIRWQDWGDQLRKLFIKDVEAKRLATNKTFDAPDRDRNARFVPDIIVYFLGKPVDSNPMDFEVSDYRKFAIVIEPKGVYKDYPSHSFLKAASPNTEARQPPKPEPPRVYPMPPVTEPRSSTASDRIAPITAHKKDGPPIAPRPQQQATPVSLSNYRPVDPAPRSNYYVRSPKPRPGIIQAAKEWILGLFG